MTSDRLTLSLGAAIATLAALAAGPSTGALAGDGVKHVAISQDVRAQANDIFENRCAACHGPEGRGDGPAASNLKPRPIDFHNRAWQKSVSDEKIAKAIVYGGRSVGLSNQMAPNPDLQDNRAVVDALVERIRGWGK